MQIKLTVSNNLTNFSGREVSIAELNHLIKTSGIDFSFWEDWGNRLWYDGVFDNKEIKPAAKKNGIAEFKKQLPCFIASSNSRAKGGNVLPFVQIDIDSVHGQSATEIIEVLVEKFSKNLVFVAKSPSGTGVKGLILVDRVTEWEDFKFFSKAVIAEILQGVDLQGGNCEDVFAPNQVCFFVNPEGGFFNDAPVPYATSHIKIEAEAPSQKTKTATPAVVATKNAKTGNVLTGEQAAISAQRVAATIGKLASIDTSTLARAAMQAKGYGLSVPQALSFLQPLVANLDGRLAKDGKFFAKTYPEAVANDNTEIKFGSFLKGGNTEAEKLKINTYISEVSAEVGNFIARFKNCAIQAPTGAGKTFSIPSIAAEYGKKVIFVAPSIAILKQAPASFGRFFEGEKNAEMQITVTTYASFKKCAEEIMAIGYFASDVVVVFDESHGFASQTFESYSEAYSMFGFFGKNILLSATQNTFGLDAFEGIAKLEISRIENPKTAFKIIEIEENLRQAAADAACADVVAGIPTIVALNNKKAELIEFLKMVAHNGVETLVFNADTKNSTEVQQLLQDSEIPVGKLLIMTQVGFAGLNIKTKTNLAKVYVLETKREVPITTIDLQQLSGRFRNADAIEVKVYKGKSENNSVYDLIFDFPKPNIDKEVLDSIDKAFDSEEVEAAIAAGFTGFLGLQNPVFKGFLKISRAKLVADERKAAAVAHMAYNRMAADSSAHFAFHLRAAGFDVEVLTPEEPVELKVDASDEIKADKEATQRAVAAYVEEFANLDSDELTKIKREAREPSKKMAATLVSSLYKLGVSKDSLVKLAAEISSESKVVRIVKKVKGLFIASTRKSTKPYKMREFVLSKGVGFEFSTADLVSIFNHFFPKYQKTYTPKQLEIEAIETIGGLVGLGKATRRSEGGIRTQYRQLVSDSPFGFKLW